MKRDYIDFNDRSIPIGYLITFRCYGTWLHGDERGSVDRHHRAYGTPGLKPSAIRRKHDRELLKQPPVRLNSRQREVVKDAIRETCTIRGWQLGTVNVRTNHIHSVVTATKKPDVVLSALKANATRAMREAGLWTTELSPWEFRGSKKYLWDEKQLADAIAYVDYDQGEPLDQTVRTRSGSDGIDQSSCALIRSLPLAVLTRARDVSTRAARVGCLYGLRLLLMDAYPAMNRWAVSGRPLRESVRTRSGSDGIDQSRCTLIRSLPLCQTSLTLCG